MNDRADPLGKPDISGFSPRKPPPKPDAAQVRKVAEQASFTSREPSQQPSPEPAARRGRKVHFQCKVSMDVDDEIYRLTGELKRRAQEQIPGVEWTVGMTVERMVVALKRELEQ